MRVFRQGISCRRTAFSLAVSLRNPKQEDASLPLRGSCGSCRENHRNFYRQVARRDHVEVGPLSRGVTFEPLSEPLQPGVRFLHDPLPALPIASLTIRLPAREQPRRAEIRAYPVPCQQHEQLRSCLSTGGALSTCPCPRKRHRPLTILVRAYSVAFARL
jgi:hypothetical protein